MIGRPARDGVALVTSLAIVLVVGVLVVGAILTTQVELFVTRNDSTAAQAQYVAQAGLQTYKAALFQHFRLLESGGASGGSLADACSNSLAKGIDFDRSGSLTPWVDNQMTLPSGQVLDTDGQEIGSFGVTIIRDPGNVSRFTVQSVGTTAVGGDTRRATSTARATFIIRNSSTLEQAIFAGDGSGMRFVNGNTTIYGGVYIVGNRDDPDELVFQSNGTLGIFNAYDKRDQSSTLGQFLVGEALQSQNLCAALRVESGRVAIGGSTQLGTPAAPLLTVAVGRGLEDVDVTQGGTLECQSNKGVCVESAVGPFDIVDNPPRFPRLDEQPGTELCPSPDTWRDCIRDEAEEDGIVITNVGGVASVAAPPGVTLSEECSAFLTAAALSAELTFNSDPIDCTAESNGRTVGFRYSSVSGIGKFETYGNINLRGFDVEFQRWSEYRAVSRDDLGGDQPFANLSVEALGGVGGSLTVKDSFVADAAYGRFPDNVLSVVAEEVVHLQGGNNSYVTAPMYAGTMFRVRGRTQLFGQVIADQFCTTSNQDECNPAGNPAEIVFVPTGENRARSFRSIAPTGGLPTFTVEVYEMR